MNDTSLDADALVAADAALAAQAVATGTEEAVWAIAAGDDVHVGAHGAARDAIFRISSMTKPVTAAAAMALLEDGAFALTDPIDRWIPELAGRQVMRDPHGDLHDTVPATQPITVEDLLTFRLGWGMDFDFSKPQPVLEAFAKLGLGSGPPEPQTPPDADEWVRRMATLPLSYQPGERWLYHVGADVLGVLLARAAGAPLADVLRERILEPLGMTDTDFAVPAEKLHRLGPCRGANPETGERFTYDEPDGQWSRPPAFPSGGAGLVSTVDDFVTFARMLASGGAHGGARILRAESVAAMTTNHLTDAQLAASAPDPSGTNGWGYGMGVRVASDGSPEGIGTYGWGGGLGSVWGTDPTRDLTWILLTSQMWTSPEPPPIIDALRRGAYAAVGSP
jgi:CubicO group peptidase (beta-lactamase class C family)